ncbi:MAG: hypothetical protein AAGF81_21300, partial [Pseudomonadota bacterium]
MFKQKSYSWQRGMLISLTTSFLLLVVAHLSLANAGDHSPAKMQSLVTKVSKLMVEKKYNEAFANLENIDELKSNTLHFYKGLLLSSGNLKSGVQK